MLSVKHITKRYGAQPVLRGIALEVAAGEFISLLGPSGCGKTTLLRILCGIETPDTGSIHLLGQDITRQPASQRRFGVVFQSYALFPNLTVAQNVSYGLQDLNRRERAARALEMLALVGLAEQAHKFPAQLSGGQQQRVALARALAPRPRLLLLDEPLSALDAQVRVGLRSEIRRLQKQLGITTLMVTHDQDEALSMSDRVVLMHQGQVEQQGSPQVLYAKPVSPFAAGFVGKMNLLPALVVGGGRVRVGEQELVCDTHLFKTGSPVLLGLRPEAIVLRPLQITSSAHAQINCLRAELLDTVFLGPCTLVRLRCESLGAEHVLEAELPTARDAQLPAWLQGREGRPAQLMLEIPRDALHALAQPLSMRAEPPAVLSKAA
ncbi:putative 2-aminoethylphosphonate ABC transporter ATP-binding protein [Paucibacter sp. KBW04]|uniref:ABC transporter ATP-binding protein n=1 Tax=Paucibacter sp. KBW04 TaxID=2153361 RepID=UPI000F57369D|nr:ATP-binding cassette domain-containing protein [Paucibacter sp. KBW04]RQO62113.1 putative 2-aminoethylphosphonate ABC transporter ATP-binding protein [Paucibacter sp. KBW04]